MILKKVLVVLNIERENKFLNHCVALNSLHIFHSSNNWSKEKGKETPKFFHFPLHTSERKVFAFPTIATLSRGGGS